jgi:hypothetical protein
VKFNYIIGNPPYQSPDSAASKLYIDISKRVIKMINKGGEIIFLTPQAIAQPNGILSKFYKNNIEYVDYTADEKFDVGVYIVEWKVTTSQRQKIKVINKDKSVDFRDTKDEYFLIDKDEIEPRKYIDRMVKINGENPLIIHNSPNPSPGDDYPKCSYNKYSIVKNAKTNAIFHTNVLPPLYNKRKLSIQSSMNLNNESMWDDNRDYGGLIYSFDISKLSETEIHNLKAFILSPPFKALQMMFRSIRMTGFSNILGAWNTLDFSKERTDAEILDLLCKDDKEKKMLKKYYNPPKCKDTKDTNENRLCGE